MAFKLKGHLDDLSPNGCSITAKVKDQFFDYEHDLVLNFDRKVFADILRELNQNYDRPKKLTKSPAVFI